VNVAASRDSHATLNHGSEVSDNVSKHVVGHDYIKPFRILDEPHGSRIHVRIVALDVGVILLADLVEGAFPQIEGKRQHVGFPAESQLLVLVPLACELEGITQATLDASAR